MNQENRKYKRYKVPRLRFPTKLKFTTSGDGFLLCNGKKVMVVSSEVVLPEHNPPVDFPIFGIGVFNFEISEVDYFILSFVNISDNTRVTDCAIIKKDELVSRLKPYHYDGDKINLKLILTDRGLHECLDYSGEGFFIALWIDNSRNFTEYLNNWSVFND